MQRRERHELAQAREQRAVDERRLDVAIATVHDAMAGDVGRRPAELVERRRERGGVVVDVVDDDVREAAGVVEKGRLERRAAGVDGEDDHRCQPLISGMSSKCARM